jgi:hypothetical protein
VANCVDVARRTPRLSLCQALASALTEETDRQAIERSELAGISGLVAGAMSMASGAYVSVSSQSDTENADLALEKKSLEHNFEFEKDELLHTASPGIRGIFGSISCACLSDPQIRGSRSAFRKSSHPWFRK